MEQKNALKITLLLVAVKSIIVGALAILIGVSLGGVASMVSAIPGASSVGSGVELAITVMWIVGIVEFFLGLSAIITAAVIKK